MPLSIVAAIMAAMWIWVVPAAHVLPIDADGPSGLSDNADFDDVILSVTSPTVVAVSSSPTVMWWMFFVVATVLARRATATSQCSARLALTRAPPRATLPLI